jgi:hypothetical protein
MIMTMRIRLSRKETTDCYLEFEPTDNNVSERTGLSVIDSLSQSSDETLSLTTSHRQQWIRNSFRLQRFWVKKCKTMHVTKILVIYCHAPSGCFNARFGSKQNKIAAQSVQNQQVRKYSLINTIALFP